MVFELRKLSINDGEDIYEMLQEIEKEENGFINSVKAMTFEEYKQWLMHNDAASRGEGLQDWMVPQSIFWLYVDDRPVGIGKVRHYLTESLRIEGGHIGYAIRSTERNKGYGTVLLKMLLNEAKKLGIERALLTIRLHNYASLKVAVKNNGVIEKMDRERYYIWINC